MSIILKSVPPQKQKKNKTKKNQHKNKTNPPTKHEVFKSKIKKSYLNHSNRIRLSGLTFELWDFPTWHKFLSWRGMIWRIFFQNRNTDYV